MILSRFCKLNLTQPSRMKLLFNKSQYCHIMEFFLQDNQTSEPCITREQEKHKKASILCDQHGRFHDYLRISLTDRCNLRCRYCMPDEKQQTYSKENLLKSSEVLKIVTYFAKHGVSKIRLTGGEPTLRKDLTEIVGAISKVEGIRQLGLTSNGLTLANALHRLKTAGLTHINISLDTLIEEKFAFISRQNGFKQVWKAINEAEKLFPFVKINCVVMRGFNEDEIHDFIKLTENRNLVVRFIEYMPFGGNKWNFNRFISYHEMLDIVQSKYGKLMKLQDSPNDTTKAYRIPNYTGKIGFITSMSEHFCASCSRLRITADGCLKVCLHGNAEISLRDAIRNGATDKELDDLINAAVKRKKKHHAGKLFFKSSFSTIPTPFFHYRNVQISCIAKSTNGSDWRIIYFLSIGFANFKFAQTLKRNAYDKWFLTSFNNKRLYQILKNMITCKKEKYLLQCQNQHGTYISKLNDKMYNLAKAYFHCFASDSNTLKNLTHVNDAGKINMVNVGSKKNTVRIAEAVATVQLNKELIEKIQLNLLQKGDVLAVSKIAGVMAAKNTLHLIPLCHNVVLENIEINHELDPVKWRISFFSKIQCCNKTGVEMEALTAVTIASLTLYDMCKSISKEIVITNIRLIRKTGGKSDFLQ
ncbi:Molybdenum cofactor biosynthesis protein 1 [Trichinella zimbabwensis]|uniref:Molybdenum cofactor biosynthesis protein 1 n=1 Tax=Trichinella zimbabwensis TaxID=268475 RepID=A0A0V1H1H9_9BILA|nr:Molybdenum cofactor biosynthesis protein 1 [Trichinella zimbabwensis]